MLFALLVECDPGNTLGGSCWRDVHGVADFILALGGTARILLTSEAGRREGYDYGQTRFLLEELEGCRREERPLEEGCRREGDVLVVLLSGHGYSRRDGDGDEADGADEYIRTCAGVVTDDQLFERLKRIGCRMVLLGDTCHSGTMFDLDRGGIANAISISACSDRQLSMCDVGDRAGFGGSLTVALLEYPEIFRDIVLSGDLELVGFIKERLSKLGQTCQVYKT